jgi:UDP-glucose 4-epimerase
MDVSSPKKILITGGAGYIGSAAAHVLADNGHTVVVFDNLFSGKKEKIHPAATLVVGDVTSIADLDYVFKMYEFDCVMHFAAKKSVSEGQQKPTEYFNNNVLGTLNVLTCMEKYTVPKIIFSSTAAVYKADDTPGTLFTEESIIAPASVYGQSKYMSETLIQEFYNTKKISSYIILRYFNVAGDAGLDYLEDSAQNVFPLIAKAVLENSQFNIYGNDYDTIDGTGVRDYIHLSDLVDAHIKSLFTDKIGIYNLGTKIGYSVMELVKTFEDVTNKKIKTVIQPRRSGDVGTVVSDATKAEINLGWKPTRSLESMVQTTVRVYGL